MNAPIATPNRRSSLRKGLIACLTLWIGIFLQPGFAATTVVSDTFSDGDRTSSPTWYQLGSVTSTVSSATGYTISPAASGNSFITLSNFTTTTLAVGNSISLSFSVTDTITPAAASARQGLRFGLFNSNSTATNSYLLSGDNTTTITNSSFSHYTGYAGFYSLQAGSDSPGAGIYARDGSVTLSSSLYGSTTYATLGSTSTSLPTTTGTTYTVSLTLQYVSATEMDITMVANGSTITRTTSSIISSFDTVALFSSGLNGNITIDNVTVSVVPEPTMAALLTFSCFGLFALLRIRRTKGIST